MTGWGAMLVAVKALAIAAVGFGMVVLCFAADAYLGFP